MKKISAFRMGVAAVAATAMLGTGVSNTDASTVTSLSIYGDASTGGNEGVGAFTGFINYDSSNGFLTIGLTNTSLNPSAAQYITGFAFNVDGNASLSADPGTDFQNSNFQFISNINAQPFGKSVDYGAALGGNWQGGGSPNGGIAQNLSDPVEFNFLVEGSGVANLTANSFIDSGFYVRFRGGNTEPDSDKVPAAIFSNGDDNGIVVPLPAAAWGGLVLLGALGAGQRFRKRRMTETV